MLTVSASKIAGRLTTILPCRDFCFEGTCELCVMQTDHAIAELGPKAIAGISTSEPCSYMHLAESSSYCNATWFGMQITGA